MNQLTADLIREECAKICDEEKLCPEDEQYDNNSSVNVGEGTYYNTATTRCAAAIRATITDPEAVKQAIDKERNNVS